MRCAVVSHAKCHSLQGTRRPGKGHGRACGLADVYLSHEMLLDQLFQHSLHEAYWLHYVYALHDFKKWRLL